MSVRITGLFSYPIKSGAAVAHTQVDVDGRGLVGDREYMVVDEQGVFLTQREAPLLALVRLASDQVVVPAGRALVVPGRGCTVTVWGYTGPAVDCGDSAAELLSAHLGRACRLVRTPAEHGRRSDDDRSGVGFADGYPLLLISEESLADLNARLPVPLPMDRFRPNIVVAGGAAFAEDGWESVLLGAIPAEVVKPCLRCAITRVDQATGIRGDGEPLRTLGTYRKAKGGVRFGQNVVHGGVGTLRVGDRVEVLSLQASPTAPA